MDEMNWNKLLAEVKPLSASIEGLLRNTKPLEFDGKKLKLSVSYKFHKDKLDEAKNKKLIEDAAEKVLLSQVIIECTVSDTPVNLHLTKVTSENIMAVAEEMFS